MKTQLIARDTCALQQVKAVLYYLSITAAFQLLSSITRADATPPLINYQARLSDSSGNNLPDGTGYEVEAKVWSAAVGGTLVWGARYSGITVKSGTLNLILGASGGMPITGAAINDLNFAFASPDRYIGLTLTKNASAQPITSPSKILPRQQFLSIPYSFQSHSATTAANGVPSGTILPFAGAQAPAGYLLCDGSAVDKQQNSALYAAIGDIWTTTGTTATQFNLPDLRGRTAVGAGQGVALTNRSLAQMGGTEAHTLTEAEIPSHSHEVLDIVTGTTQGDANGGIGVRFVTYGKKATTATGGGQAHNNLPPYLVVNYIIKR